MSRLSRRRFLATGAMATGAAWLATDPQTALTEKPHETDQYGGFRVGLQSNVLNAYSPELEPMLANIAQLGLGWVEFARWHYPVTRDAERMAAVQTLLSQHNLKMEAYFLGDIPAEAAELRQAFEFARDHKVSVLVGQPTPEAFPLLDSLVKEFDIKVAVHNYGPGHRYDRIDDLVNAVEPWDSRIGSCLDTGHAMRAGEVPLDAVRRLGARLYGLHLREHTVVQRDPQPPESILGEGGLQLEAFCRALREIKFDGPMTIEVYYNPQQPMEVLRRCLANLAEAARNSA